MEISNFRMRRKNSLREDISPSSPITFYTYRGIVLGWVIAITTGIACWQPPQCMQVFIGAVRHVNEHGPVQFTEQHCVSLLREPTYWVKEVLAACTLTCTSHTIPTSRYPHL